jgi:hypothetical protein
LHFNIVSDTNNMYELWFLQFACYLLYRSKRNINDYFFP